MDEDDPRMSMCDAWNSKQGCPSSRVCVVDGFLGAVVVSDREGSVGWTGRISV